MGDPSSAANRLLGQLVQRCAEGSFTEYDVERFALLAVEDQQLAVDDQLAHVVAALFRCGWTPHDLREVVRRQFPEPTVGHLISVAADVTAQHSPAEVHPAWRAQLGGVEAGGGSQRWARQHRLPWPEACIMLVELLVRLVTLPGIEAVLPPPGSPPATAHPTGIDERVLRKVRALLAKAEATEYEDEADALTAKAQQLMTAHSIERSLAEADEPQQAQPAARRIWIDAPYVDAKAMLANNVAASNHCRCVFSKDLGFVTLVGFPADLGTVELLTTSLLVQAARIMTASGSQQDWRGTSRTRSFRQSFLIAYAQRIGERLTEAATETETQIDAERSGALLPVLASRSEAVDAAAAEMFPGTVERSVRISNAAGWGAGRAAADLARFDVHDAVTSER